MKKIATLFSAFLFTQFLLAQNGSISKSASDRATQIAESKRQEILQCKGLSKDSVQHIYDRFVKMLLANNGSDNKKLSYSNLEYMVSNNH
jgi:hypothetical protein